MDAIAAATGLGKGSLYGAFGSKHQLYLRIFDAYCTDIIDAVGRRLLGEEGLEERDQALLVVAHAEIHAPLLPGGRAVLSPRPRAIPSPP